MPGTFVELCGDGVQVRLVTGDLHRQHHLTPRPTTHARLKPRAERLKHATEWPCREATRDQFLLTRLSPGVSGVEQLTRYFDVLDRDPLLGRVSGVRGTADQPAGPYPGAGPVLRCVVLGYGLVRGTDDSNGRLF